MQKTILSVIINRLNDFFGKALLGSTGNKAILLDLLNAIFSDKPSAAVPDRITDVTLLDKELIPLHVDDKACRVDLLCRTNSGAHVNIELQTYIDRDLGVRLVSYATRIYAQLFDNKTPYSQIRPTVIIVISNKDLLRALGKVAKSKKDPKWHHIFGLIDTEDLSLRLTEMLEFHFIDVRKYPKLKLEKMSRLGQWSAFFRRSNDGEFAATADPIFQNVLKFEEQFMNNRDFMQIYRDREEVDRISAYANGKEDGLNEGLKKGENKAQHDFAASLLQDDLPLSFISKHTGLSLKELESLKADRS